MVYNPVLVWGKRGVAEYKCRATGEGSTFRYWKKTRVSFEECSTDMEALLIYHHMEISHRIVMPHTQGVDVGRGGLETYMLSLPCVLKLVACPADRCPVR